MSASSLPRRIGALAMRLSFAAAMIAIAGAGVTVLHLKADANKVEVAAAPLPVRVVLAERADGYHVVERFAGRVEAARQARLGFERGGLVVSVQVEEGDTASAGEVVARLDTALLQADRDRLAAQRRQVQANLELARLTLERQRTLQAQGHASSQRLDEARLSSSALEAELAAVTANIRSIDINLEKATLRAPFAGTIAARWVDEGTVVAAGTPVVELLESGRRQARIGVSPKVAEAIDRGASYEIRYRDRVLAVEAAAARPDMAPGTRTLPLLFDVIGPDRVPFGEVVELRVAREIGAPGFWLPLTALTEGERGLWSVSLADGGDEAPARISRAAVVVVHVDGDRVFVRGTLRDGDRVVVGGAEQVSPGQVVEPLLADAG